MTDIPTIAAGLTKDETTALLGHGIGVYSWPGKTWQNAGHALRNKWGLIDFCGPHSGSTRLTRLGLAVRQYLKEQER